MKQGSEIWLDIKGYEGLYKIGNMGNVIALRRGFHVMTPQVDKDGYLVVNLISKQKNTRNWKLHRLVAIHFVENSFQYDIVNHIDGNKKNNHFLNLEWCTIQYNNRHAVDTGLRLSGMGETNANAKLTNKQREEIIALRRAGYKLSQLADMYKVHFGTISTVCIKSGEKIYIHRSVESRVLPKNRYELEAIIEMYKP